ncbi:MAG: hypothetical protein JOY54_11285 [Acidobacteriaceae bacterium]|nr:hypothetical protein [Acidobacteriaceae bacterium]
MPGCEVIAERRGAACIVQNLTGHTAIRKIPQRVGKQQTTAFEEAATLEEAVKDKFLTAKVRVELR